MISPTALQEQCDDDLLTLVEQGDQPAFEELMRRNSSTSFKLAVSILRDRQEAEDAVQDSYWNAWRAVGKFQRESKFSTWISRIVLNQCLMRLRKSRRENFLYLDSGDPEGSLERLELPDTGPNPETALGSRESAKIVRQEAAKLPPLLRDVLILRDLNELPMPEVAERLGITVMAAKTRLARARTELKLRIERRRRPARFSPRAPGSGDAGPGGLDFSVSPAG
jgi:RNA polymerase sigma-70 factor, ECF subfamily